MIAEGGSVMCLAHSTAMSVQRGLWVGQYELVQ